MRPEPYYFRGLNPFVSMIDHIKTVIENFPGGLCPPRLPPPVLARGGALLSLPLTPPAPALQKMGGRTAAADFAVAAVAAGNNFVCF